MKSKSILLCVIIMLCNIVLMGCSNNNEWIEEYNSLIIDFQVGMKVLLPIKNPNGLAYDGRYIWAADYQNKIPGKIIAMDIHNGIVKKRITVLKHMEGLGWDGKDFWVGAPARKLTRLNGSSLEIIESINCPTGEDADGLAWDGKHLWIASHFHGKRGAQLVKMNIDSREILKKIDLPFREIGDIAYMDNHIWAIKFCLKDKPEVMPFIVMINPISGNIERLYHSKDLPRKMWGLTQVEGRLWLSNERSKESSALKIMEVIIE